MKDRHVRQITFWCNSLVALGHGEGDWSAVNASLVATPRARLDSDACSPDPGLMRRTLPLALMVGVLGGLATVSWRIWPDPQDTAPTVRPVRPVVGEVLQATNGHWSKAVSRYTYLWERCDSAGSNCRSAAETRQHTRTYPVTSTDVGHTIRVEVIVAFVSDGSALETSSATHLVVRYRESQPVNTTPPKITGVPTVGRTLRVTSGVWSSRPRSYTYQWQDCAENPSTNLWTNCSNITTGDCAARCSNRYHVQPSDSASSIKAVVAAHNAAGTGFAAGVTGPEPVNFNRIVYGRTTMAGPLTCGAAHNRTCTPVQEGQRYQWLVLQYNFHRSQVKTMEAANPKLKIVPYLNIIGASPTDAAPTDCVNRTNWSRVNRNANAHAGDPYYDWFLTKAGVTTLSSGLFARSPITSLPVNSLPRSMTSGMTLQINDGAGHTQNWITRRRVRAGAASIPVYSQRSNFSYSPGTKVYPRAEIARSGLWVLDPGNTSFQNFCDAQARVLYTAGKSWKGGQFWDEADTAPAAGQNAYYDGTEVYPNLYPWTAWRYAVVSFLAHFTMYMRSHRASANGVVNGGAAHRDVTPSVAHATAYSKALMNAIGGNMQEGWGDGGDGLTQQDAFFGGKLSNALWAEESHKYMLMESTMTTADRNEAATTYAFAGALLAANGYTSYGTAFGGCYGGTEACAEFWIPEFDTGLQLGPAVSGLQSRTDGNGHVFYERDFSNGVVLVNPSQNKISSVSPTPGGTYSGRDCAGAAGTCSTLRNRDRVALSTDGAAILLRYG